MGSMVVGKEFKWREPVHHLLWIQQKQHFSPHSTAKIKAHSSGRKVSSGRTDVVIASVHSEKTRLKKLMMRIITSDRKTIY